MVKDAFFELGGTPPINPIDEEIITEADPKIVKGIQAMFEFKMRSLQEVAATMPGFMSKGFLEENTAKVKEAYQTLMLIYQEAKEC